MSVTVTGLAFTPIKGLRLRTVDALEIDERGAVGDRRFYVVDARDRMVNGKTIGELSAVVAALDGERLELTFPDGRVVAGEVHDGGPIRTRFFSLMREDRLVAGPWAQALSAHVGQPLRLVRVSPGRTAIDRGARGGVSVIGRASLARLAAEGELPSLDVRRFRMTVEVDGVPAHAEDGWLGHRVRLGEVLVRFHGNVGRCLITSRDPDTGVIDTPTLTMLARYREQVPTTEPLPFGIHGEVLETGRVTVGDAVTLID